MMGEVKMRKLVIPILLLTGSLCFSDTVIMTDGSQHYGVVQSTSRQYVTLKEGNNIHRYQRTDVRSIEFDNSTNSNNSSYAPPLSPSSARQNIGRNGMNSEATIPAGTQITVMNNENIDSSTANEGGLYSADVAEDVTNANGQVVIPRGAQAELVIRQVQSQGTVTGNSELVLDLQSVNINGQRYLVNTQDLTQHNNEGIGANKRTATMIGGGAVLGTLIGAIAGGGKGAAIGAATGAAAGAGAQVLTRGKEVKVPAESKLSFRLDQPLHLQRAY
jgi:hypothetical protein